MKKSKQTRRFYSASASDRFRTASRELLSFLQKARESFLVAVSQYLRRGKSFGSRWLRTAATQGGADRGAVDMRRRNFIKLTVFGGSVFLAGKYFGPFVNMLRGDTVINETFFNNFKVTETGRELRITDDGGEEFLIIEKDNF